VAQLAFVGVNVPTSSWKSGLHASIHPVVSHSKLNKFQQPLDNENNRSRRVVFLKDTSTAFVLLSDQVHRNCVDCCRESPAKPCGLPRPSITVQGTGLRLYLK